MAFHVSPGVYWKEVDISNYIKDISTTQLGIVGTATKGPVNELTLITSVEQFVKVFGIPSDFYNLYSRQYNLSGVGTHWGMYAAYQYLLSGNQLWYVRVESEEAPASAAFTSILDIHDNELFIEAQTPGSFYNDLFIRTSYASSGRGGTHIHASYNTLVYDTDHWTVSNVGIYSHLTPGTNSYPALGGTVRVYYRYYNPETRRAYYATLLLDDGDGNLVPYQGGVNFINSPDHSGVTDLAVGDISGTVNYADASISITINKAEADLFLASLGNLGSLVSVCSFPNTFNLTVYKKIGVKEYTLEDFRGLSINVNHSNYYVNELARRSTIIKDIKYFDVAGTVQSLPYIPIVYSDYSAIFGRYGKFKAEHVTGTEPHDTICANYNGGNSITTSMYYRDGYDGHGTSTTISSLSSADFIGKVIGNTYTGLQLLSVPEVVDINTIMVPGVSEPEVINEVVSICESRRDCLGVLDPPRGMAPDDVVDWANGSGEWLENTSINSSYATIYYPWVRIYDSYNEQEKWLPPSRAVAGIFAEVDRRWNVSYAPAGENIGSIPTILGVERILSQGERDYLYENRINPINDFPATGIRVYGQKTAQTYASATDRINVRRLLIYTEKLIVTFLQPYVFKPVTQQTMDEIKTKVQPYLDHMVRSNMYYEAKIVCDFNINTPESINNNELRINLFLKPVKSAEKILVNFVILDTGANIEEYVGKSF